MEKRVEPLWKVCVLGVFTCGFYVWWYLNESLRDLGEVGNPNRHSTTADSVRNILNAFCIATLVLLAINVLFLIGEEGNLARLLEKWPILPIVLFLIAPVLGGGAFLMAFLVVDQYQKARNLDAMETIIQFILGGFSVFLGVVAVIFLRMTQPGIFFGLILVILWLVIGMIWLALTALFNLEINRFWEEGFKAGSDRQKPSRETSA